MQSMRNGRDHIASVVNTLVLAFAGAALPLLLLFTQAGIPLGEIMNGEPVATEIVRMLSGSIGLVAAVPITTALTALVVGVDHRPSLLPPAHEQGDLPRTRRGWRRKARSWEVPRAEREVFDEHPRERRDG